MAQGIITLAGSRMYTSMADTDEVLIMLLIGSKMYSEKLNRKVFEMIREQICIVF